MTLLSICIPCYGRVEYVRKTLKSIFIDNADVPLEKYEVIISDNDSNQAIKVLTEEFKYPNLIYFYTNCEGFMNSYYVLTYAQGEFFKLHNSQTLFRKGSLSKIISEIKNNIENKTLIFYTNGLLGSRKSQTYSNFNDFMYNLSYWSSWSNGFNIWKSEFDKIDKNLKLNKLFPHTSLFLTQHQAKLFCINDNLLFDVQRIPKRGGHNKFEAFTIEYPSLLDECCKKGHISTKCKKHILFGIMVQFLPSLLFNKYIIRIETFDDTGFRNNLKKYYPSYAYWLVLISVLGVPFRLFCRKLKNKR